MQGARCKGISLSVHVAFSKVLITACSSNICECMVYCCFEGRVNQPVMTCSML